MEAATRHGLEFRFLEEPLNTDTAVLSKGCEMVVIFAGDDASEATQRRLIESGVRHIAVRAAGYDNVDIVAAHALGLKVANVPAYSPHAIAEHAVALMLALNRRIVQADHQVHRFDFTVGGLVGFDLYEKTVGIIGTGRIGSVAARILNGFGCKLLAYDIAPDNKLSLETGVHYTDLYCLCEQSDIISLHTCLSPETRYLINEDKIRRMKPGVMLINTARGAVVNTADVLAALQSGQIGSYGADVYEREKGVFFYDHSSSIPDDPMLHELLAHPNVLLTPHQAFVTWEALSNLAETTCFNIACWQRGASSPNEL
jgi:D-lactate dehydrogenase